MNAPANACSCERCQGACQHKPGWFRPEQIAPLAAALGLTEQQLFDHYLQVDWWVVDDGNEIFVLSPGVVRGDLGGMFDRDPRGTCVWFKDGKCAIHELGKPYECASWRHDTPEGCGQVVHHETARSWADHADKVRQLLGRDPESRGSWGLMDMLFG